MDTELIIIKFFVGFIGTLFVYFVGQYLGTNAAISIVGGFVLMKVLIKCLM